MGIVMELIGAAVLIGLVIYGIKYLNKVVKIDESNERKGE